MSYMFGECDKLKEIKGINNFNTSNVIDMSYMFSVCKKLKEIKGINHFNTSKVQNMNHIFQYCYELEYIDLSNFDTSNVIDMSFMFFFVIN